MVRITEDLLRRRAEHNNMELSTLEEISLHQQDIEKIELLDKICRDLKIVYLQSNLIPKIENVKRLKKLEYLNLALNNIERIENLEGCESLKKLDLTINFVGELSSIECLKHNYNLEEMFLTGNPCVDFDGYRDYVIATLPQLKHLDGTSVEKSERIKAVQDLATIKADILKQQKEYQLKREREKTEENEKAKRTNKKPGFDGRWYTDINVQTKVQNTKVNEDELDNGDVEEDNSKFWEEKVAFTPESRKAVHEHVQKQREKEEIKRNGPEPKKRVIHLVGDDGRILNVNEAKLDFTISDSDDGSSLILDVACFKHLDTSLMDADVQPNYVKVTVKGKVLQLVLSEEVKPDSSTAKRSQTTGHLVIEMPKLYPRQPVRTLPYKDKKNKENNERNDKRNEIEHLEVDPSASKTIDLLVTKTKTMSTHGSYIRQTPREERPNSKDFIDDPDVPPLI